ncbi:MAG: hypothetical protein GY822_03200 [Deltaproteobacteria bacterium]|nr:hypothetical protein [Deltaproteobacteria bacterium]
MNISESKTDQASVEESFENVVKVDFSRSAKAPDDDYSIKSLPQAPRGEEKLFAFEKLVEVGMVMVTLDTRRKGVQVPARFRNDLQLHLNFSHRFGIDDFLYDEQGVQASLSFHGRALRCVVPWTAVYMMRSHVDQAVAIFPEDLPEEMQDVAVELEKALKTAQKLQIEEKQLEEKQLKEAEAAKPKLLSVEADEKLSVSDEVRDAKLGEKSIETSDGKPFGLHLVPSE